MGAHGNLSEIALRELCRQRGITITRRGQAFVLAGPGVEIVCVDLEQLRECDLRPRRESEGADADRR